MTDDDEMVWVRVGNGRSKLMAKSRAEAEGLEIEPPPPPRDWSAGPESNTYRLTPEERKKIYEQTGVHVEDYAHYKRVCKERGWRDIEAGERADIARKQIVEWVDSGCPGPCPAGRTSMAPMPVPKVDMQELKYKLRNGYLR